MFLAGVASVVLVLALAPVLDAVPRQAETAKPAPSCDGTEGTVTFSVSSSRNLGETSTALPAEAGAIKIVVTVPANRSSDNGACGLGDERVDAGTCPEKGECAGFTIKANNDAGLDACHGTDQTLGPYDWPLPQGGGVVKLLFNAVTEKVSTANVELTCKRAARSPLDGT